MREFFLSVSSRRFRGVARPALVVFAALLCALNGCQTLSGGKKKEPEKKGMFWNVPLLGDLVSADVLPISPSNRRDWAPTHAVLPEVEWDGGRFTVKNVRNFEYVTEDDYLVRYENRTYDLKDLETVDFIVVPFPQSPSLAHTMLSFGFKGDKYLASSIEVRLENGEKYSPVLGAMRQYEIMYVLADERDVIRLRTEVRNNDVYVYRVQTEPTRVRELLVDVIDRVNKLHDEPEFYDTLTNNCTTNIVKHVNKLVPDRVPYDYEILLPGLSPQLAYRLGLIDTRVSLEELNRRSNVTARARQYRSAADFSRQIRR